MTHAPIGIIQKNSREQLHVGLREFHGTPLVNLRVWFEPRDGGDLRPGKDGVALRIEKLPELIAVLERAEAEARRLGLLPERGTA